MKKKYIAILMGVMMAASVFTGCGQSDSTENAGQDTTVEAVVEDTGVLGEVTVVGEDSITIAVGTRKERGGQGNMEKPDGKSGEKPQGEAPSGEPGEKPQGDRPSMLELTGEEQTITITENTVITKMSIERPEGNAEKPQQEEGEERKERTQQATETISFNDIEEGDTVSIILDEEGNAESIMVQSMGMGGRQGKGASQSQD